MLKQDQISNIEWQSSEIDQRKFSNISNIEFNTPETQHRSTITPQKYQEWNTLHFRHKTQDIDYNKFYEEIQEQYIKTNFEKSDLFQPKIRFENKNAFPNRVVQNQKIKKQSSTI